MENNIKLITLWTLLLVCMILHFDYHVSEIFYGIDVKRPDANGTVPASILFIRSAFHFVPLLFVAALLWFSAKPFRWAQLALSVLYSLSHFFHLFGELKKGDNPSQIALLSVTFILSVLLIVASWQWVKEKAKTGQQ